MTASEGARQLLDDCFLHDKERMRHEDVVSMLRERLGCIAGIERVALAESHRRIVAKDVEAPRPVPLHENAAVDGYAFAHASYLNHDGRLRLAARLAAGDLRQTELGDGECARIFTGAVMPDGADTVAMQEDCQTEVGLVIVPKGLKPGANCRHAGEDLKKGEALVRAGQSLRPQDIAALASIGVAEVKVRKPLRIAVMSTGNEIVSPGNDIRHGQVYDSNSAMLETLAENAGGNVSFLGIVPDDAATIRAVLKDAAKSHDMILTTGGASRGEEDHMLGVIDELGKRHMWQIAIKPGRPMMFGQIGDCITIGLPGNPVAAFVCFLLYVRLAMLQLGGGEYREPVRYPLPAAFEVKHKKPDRREFLRGYLVTDSADGMPAVQKYPQDGSGLISGLRAAGGLIELPETAISVGYGELVRFIPFSEFGIC